MLTVARGENIDGCKHFREVFHFSDLVADILQGSFTFPGFP